jgi:putative tryptophan/tyrosine transport system substrate-binding protein
MRRRDFITIAGGLAVAWPLAAAAQQSGRVRRIGVIMNYAEDDPEGQARYSALLKRLKELGWGAGRDIQIDGRWVAGKTDLMQAYAAELVRLPVDIIIANSTPLLAELKRITHTIPIVFAQVADPVNSGFVISYAHPGANITGFSDFDTSIAGKWVEVLKEAVPSVSRGTVLMDPDQKNHQSFWRVIESTAALFKMKVSAAEVRNRSEIEQVMATLNGQGDDGLIVLPGPVNNTSRDSIIRLAARQHVAAVYPFKYFAKDGGLLYYGIDQLGQWSGAAEYVDRILKGEKPADLPVQAPTRYELVVNLKTAKAFGFTLPPTLLARADEVIE